MSKGTGLKNDDCIFCKLIGREIPSNIVYEDDNTLAFLDAKPVNRGHTLVLPKGHYKNIYEIPDDLLQNLITIIKKVALAVESGARADGINIHLNNDPVAGQEIPHIHFHIIPRNEDDNFEQWHGNVSESDEERKVLAKQIHNQIEMS